MSAGELVTGDDVCAAVERALREHLPAWAREYPDLGAVSTWTQLPVDTALDTAVFPAGAISSPGLTRPPTRSGRRWEATWRVAVAVYDRGRDHAGTATRSRRWAALVRAAVLAHPALGIDATTAWVGEEYALRPERSAARTLGGCAVAFDITLRDVVPPDPPRTPGQGPAPVARTAKTSVTIRPHQE